MSATQERQGSTPGGADKAPPVPAAVWLAVVASAIIVIDIVAVAIVSSARDESGGTRPVTTAVQVGIVLLVGVGLVRRSRLAWQGARLIGGFAGIFVALLALFALLGERYWYGAALAVGALAGLSVAVAMGRPSAIAHFQLVCPQCSDGPGKSADLAFARAQCRRCRFVW